MDSSGAKVFGGGSSSSSSSSWSIASSTCTLNSSLDSSDDNLFPIMQLPVEIRAKIFNMLNQKSVPTLRLVCNQWKDEIEKFYEFTLNIYDTTINLNLIRNLRCRECTIWKLTQTAGLSPPSLFLHPSYLKIIKVYGPILAENLKALVVAAENLEQLTFTRRANYPWILNYQETPELNNLKKLKYLRLNSEEHVFLTRIRRNPQYLKQPPFTDCFFPSLKHFEILKRFPVWQYAHHITDVLRFVARHAKTLKSLELDLIPLSCVAFINDEDNFVSDGEDSSESDEERMNNIARYRKEKRSHQNFLSPEAIDLPQLKKMNLLKCCVTTKGSDRDIFIWKSILETQTELRELRFDWLCRDPRAEFRARVTGFPWFHFQCPIEKCSESLVCVELTSLSMFATSRETPRSARVIPFDLGIFRNCRRLKSLVLRCRETQARIQEVDEQPPNADDDDEDREEPGPAPVPAVNNLGNGNGGGDDTPPRSREVLLMINAMELPIGLETLEIYWFPMLNSDLEAMIRKCVNLKKLFLHECGKSGTYGVSADVIKLMAKLTQLKFLEIIGFNDSTPHRKRELEEVFQSIGLPYEGQDTWLEFDDGSSSAYESLKNLN